MPGQNSRGFDIERLLLHALESALEHDEQRRGLGRLVAEKQVPRPAGNLLQPEGGSRGGFAGGGQAGEKKETGEQT